MARTLVPPDGIHRPSDVVPGFATPLTSHDREPFGFGWGGGDGVLTIFRGEETVSSNPAHASLGLHVGSAFPEA
jgi:hypothetical protein